MESKCVLEVQTIKTETIEITEHHLEAFEPKPVPEFETVAPSIAEVYIKPETLETNASISKCETCDLHFPTKTDLTTHSLTHENPYKCTECDERFPQIGLLTAHFMLHANSYECHVCHKRFGSVSMLRTHTSAHERQKHYKCGTCGRSCGTQISNYQRHVLTHMGWKTFRCAVCKIRVADTKELKVHLQTHGDLYACEVCGDEYPRAGHVCVLKSDPTKEVQLYKCRVCDKRFAKRYLFNVHLAEHAIGKFKCKVCEKKFKRQHTLKQHVLLHMGQRPYKCAKCDKTFRDRCNYKYHLWTHMALFTCKVCGNDFQTHRSLNVHLRSHLESTCDEEN